MELSGSRATTNGTKRGSEHAPTSSPSPSPGEVREAFERARAHLLSLQEEDGHWCGLLEGDSAVASEYILVLHFFGRAHETRAEKLANFIRSEQGPDGGWSLHPGGSANVSSSVKAYFVLKLLGDDPEASHMVRARCRILEMGGIEATNTYTKIYLAFFEQYPWDGCPAVPPEMLLLPRWSPIDLSDMSSWSRGIFVPLSVLWAVRPTRPVPDYADIGELFVEGTIPAGDDGRPTWRAFFDGIDRSLKYVESRRLTPLRRHALRRAERWIRDRLPRSDGLQAIFPAIANAAMALRALGLHPDHPAVRSQLEALERLEVELDGDRLLLQPCKSPVWDTANALNVLRTAGLGGGHDGVVRAVEWLLDREVTEAGDWRDRNPDGPVGGWYFEYENEFYPDTDDTAEVLTSLANLDLDDPALGRLVEAASERGVAWLLSMQNRDGGWGAFDRDCDKEVLTHVPFADHNAMIDPSTVDITGRTLEALVACGLEPTDPVVHRGAEFILGRQEDDGSWYGRWGANHVYGTWLALAGLEAAGIDMQRSACRRAVDWLLEHQNPDGGWGESLRSYSEPEWIGRGESTASQTSWALLALIAAGEVRHQAVARGLRFLLDTQQAVGDWSEEPWTGTGFPGVFYLRYHYYATYFPLLTLATYRRALAERGESEKVA